MEVAPYLWASVKCVVGSHGETVSPYSWSENLPFQLKLIASREPDT